MALEKLQVKIGGMACSFCVETITKGLGRTAGVAEVNVSLAHEEALIAYDPSRVTATTLTDTLRSLGYTVRDPNKVRTFEDEEAELTRERDRLVVAGAAAWIGFMVMLLMWIGRHHPLAHWSMAALAILMVFGPGLYILKMAWASVRRRILTSTCSWRSRRLEASPAARSASTTRSSRAMSSSASPCSSRRITSSVATRRSSSARGHRRR